MVKIRHLKDYEGLADEARTWTSPDDEVNTGSGESASGQSWLSNTVIIASLEDKKIRAQCDYHRTMLRLLEQELLARASGARQARRLPDYDKPRAPHSGEATNGKRSTRLSKVERVIQQATKLGLSPEVIRQILG